MQINHPWKTIVSPGPWAQLPPAPAPVPTPRSKHVRPREPPPNPFGEEEEDTRENPSAAAATQSGNVDTDAAVCSSDAGHPSDEAQCQVPRSLSVPAITSAPSQSSLQHFDLTETNEFEQVTSRQSKV